MQLVAQAINLINRCTLWRPFRISIECRAKTAIATQLPQVKTLRVDLEHARIDQRQLQLASDRLQLAYELRGGAVLGRLVKVFLPL